MDNNEVRLKCEKCNFSAVWKFSLQSHIKRSHGTLRMDLFNCNLAFIEKFECFDWDYDSLLKVDFDNHLRRGHDWDNPEFIYEIQEDINQKLWECPYCALTTFSCFLVQAHNCKEQFKLETKIKILEGDVSGELPKIKEEVCDNSSSKSQTKGKLRRLSSAIKGFICQKCPYKSKSKGHLNRHILMKHSPEDKIKWFICQECPYKSKSKSDLKIHILRKHTPENKIKWFICEKCPYKSKTKGALNLHILWTHTPTEKIEWFICQKCPYKSESKGNLKRHILRNHAPEDQIEWFICQKCPHKSKSKGDLEQHINETYARR